jgi:ABC-type branched-subunit amino acid transport system permease subunit
VPLSLLLVVGGLLILTYLAKRTTFGRHVYAVGGNAEAARRAGINVARIRILVFAIAGGMSGLGGIVLAARLNSVDLNAGGGTLLIDAIAAAVIGGTSLFGGRGEIRDALIGATLISTVSNGMFIEERQQERHPPRVGMRRHAWSMRSYPGDDTRTIRSARTSRSRTVAPSGYRTVRSVTRVALPRPTWMRGSSDER